MARSKGRVVPSTQNDLGTASWNWPNHREHVQCLSQELQDGMAEGSPDDKKHPAAHAYTLKARFFNHVCGPFHDLERVIKAGLGIPNTTPGKPFTDDEKDAFKAIAKLIPNLANTLNALLVVSSKVFLKLIYWMQASMEKGRQDDTTRISENIVEIIVPNPKQHHPNGLSKSTPRSARGWNLNPTARLLCPFSDLSEFDKDPTAYRQKVQDGRTIVTASQWPTFLFPDSESFDAKELDKGLCDSEILVRALRATLTGPSTIHGDPRTADTSSVAFKHEYTVVTAEDAAYHAVLLYTVLSSAPRFVKKFMNFNLKRFFLLVRNYLTEPDPKSRKTLESLTQRVPGLGHGPKDYMMSRLRRDDSLGEDPLELIRQQRQQRQTNAQRRELNTDGPSNPASTQNGRGGPNDRRRESHHLDAQSQSGRGRDRRQNGGARADQNGGGGVDRRGGGAKNADNERTWPREDDFDDIHIGGGRDDRNGGDGADRRGGGGQNGDTRGALFDEDDFDDMYVKDDEQGGREPVESGNGGESGNEGEHEDEDEDERQPRPPRKLQEPVESDDEEERSQSPTKEAEVEITNPEILMLMETYEEERERLQKLFYKTMTELWTWAPDEWNRFQSANYVDWYYKLELKYRDSHSKEDILADTIAKMRTPKWLEDSRNLWESRKDKFMAHLAAKRRVQDENRCPDANLKPRSSHGTQKRPAKDPATPVPSSKRRKASFNGAPPATATRRSTRTHSQRVDKYPA